MRVRRLIVMPVVFAAIVVGSSVACDDGTSGCRIDTDCPPGNICRGSICGLANPEAGTFDASITVFDSATSCAGDGILCVQATECCSGNCTDGRCATSPSSTPACKGLYQICQNDCCSGYTCKNGSCQ